MRLFGLHVSAGSVCLTVLLVVGALVWSGGAAAAEREGRPGGSIFSAAEAEALYRKMKDQAEDSFVPLLDSNGPVIELEPYVVSGDSAPLLLAAVRRHLEQGSESIRRRVAEFAPVLNHQTEIDARAVGEFFDRNTGPGPRDRPGLVYLDAGEAVRLGRELGDAIGRTISRGGRRTRE